MRPFLFTSIPPRHQGTDFATADGAAPQVVTIRSWLEAGFHPVSIHPAGEIDRHSRLPEALQATGVECVVLRATAVEPAAPLLCPFIDLLQAIHQRADEAPFAIINADIRIAGPSRDGPVALMRRLTDDAFLIGQRTDVGPRRIGGVREEVFPHGLDFLALHRRWIDRVLDFLSPSLAFGRPWWDHYLPLALIACGARPCLVAPGRCRHDIHDTRWNWRHYCSIGKSALHSFQAAAERLDPPVTARRWVDATTAEFGPFVPSPCVAVLRRLALHEAAPVFLTASFFKRQAAANMKLILQSAIPVAPPSAPVSDSRVAP
jgi:hypothetical protein